ncbi:AbrB/MazE/SpoVT family DNA-binding domain-containing protein [Micromonospora echinospora]|uniref:AbrB/MazE/SpoVT family DNA-binding domain-containing protein n=1 Tax=Micromonospora echinospora TaxID=1877 RepID=UPI003CF7A16E
MVYGLAAIDSSGRIADRTVIRALGWGPGTRLHIREGSGVIVVRSDRQGVFTVTSQGHLHLPAAVRHWCGLAAGDRVLLAASPADGLLVVHPPAALDAMVVAAHADLLGGGQA